MGEGGREVENKKNEAHLMWKRKYSTRGCKCEREDTWTTGRRSSGLSPVSSGGGMVWRDEG